MIIQMALITGYVKALKADDSIFGLVRILTNVIHHAQVSFAHSRNRN